MKNLVRRIRGALGMGLTWAVGWGAVGGLIELISNIWPGLGWPDVVDMWPQTLAIPGFLGGVVFSAVLRITAGGRRFDELSTSRFAAWGAVGGLVLGVLVVAWGVAFGNFPLDWRPFAIFIVPPTLLGAGSASACLALARMGEDRELLDVSEDVAEVGLTKEETRELLGGQG